MSAGDALAASAQEVCVACEADGTPTVSAGDDIALCNAHWNRWLLTYLDPGTGEPPCAAHLANWGTR